MSGNAVRYITPDIISWTINVSSDNPDLIAAKQDNDRRFQAALAVAQTMTARPGEVEAGGVWIDRQYTRNEYGGIRAFSHFSVRRELRLEALEVARAKAEAMAARLGQRLGRATTISEFAPAVDDLRSSRSMGAPGSVMVEPTSPEKRCIGETVYVTFELK